MFTLRSIFGNEADILHERDFQILLLANILPPLSTALLSPVLDSLIDPFGTTPANIGLMVSFITAPGIIMYPIAGVLADNYGRKLMLVAGLTGFGVSGAAISLTTDFHTALFLRLLQGISMGGITPVIITSIGDLYVATEEATAQGIRFTGSGLTSTVFPLLSGLLVLIAWQLPFLIYAIALPIALIVYYWFEEPTHTGSSSAADTTLQAHLTALYHLLAQRRVFTMVIARGLPMIVWIGFITYNSIVVVRVLDGTPAQAGIIVAIASLVYAAAASQAGRLTAVFDSRLYPLIGANLCLTIGFAGFLLAPDLLIGGIAIAVMGIGVGVTLSLYRSVITGLASESLRGGLVSLAEAFGRIGSTITPVAMGAIIAVLTPTTGLAHAVQLAGLGAALVGGLGGAVCLLIVSASPQVHYAPG